MDSIAIPTEKSEKQQEARMVDQSKFERLAASRIYFVRMPKPAELSSNDGLDKEKSAIDEKLKKLGTELQPIMAERSRNSSLLAEAREAVRELKVCIEDKELILNPYQQEKKAAFEDREAQRKTREEQRQLERKAREDQHRAELTAKQKRRNDFNSQYGHLGVSNDEEIDEKVRQLEFQQQHESLTIAQEKGVLKQIKQLQDSREAVREFSQWTAEDKAERDARAAQAKKRRAEKDSQPPQKAAGEKEAEKPPEDSQKEEMAELRRVVNGLWEDYKMQLDIKNRHQDIENKLKAQIEGFFEKRDALKKEREDVWAKIQKHRNDVRAANKPFSENRSFSSQVRDLVKRGASEEARQLCASQTTELMGRFAEDQGFRKEYNTLWDAAVGFKRPASTVSESHHSTAASVIAEALEAARKSVASQQRTAEKEAKPANAPKSKSEEAGGAAAAAIPAARAATIPGMEEARIRPRKEKKAPKPAPVELPKLEDTPFVPPAAALEKRAEEPSAEEVKEQQRAHNKAVQAEAALRKERRRVAAEKKKQQKAQKDAVQSTKEDLAEEVSAPETPPVEEEGSRATPEAISTAVSEENAKLKGRKVAKTTARPVPRPFSRKKGFAANMRQLARDGYSAALEHPVAAGAAAAAVLAAAAAPFVYYLTPAV